MMTTEKLEVSWLRIGEQINEVGRRVAELGTVNRVVGIARGGLPLAVSLSHRFNVPLSVVGVSSYNDTTDEQESLVCDTPDVIFEGWNEGSILVCDDIADSGKTLEFLLNKIADNSQISNIIIATLYYKEHSLIKPDIFIETTDKWVVFPWEWE